MVTAAQALSLKQKSRFKGFNENKIKEQLQFKATKPKLVHFGKNLEQADRHPALVVVDL